MKSGPPKSSAVEVPVPIDLDTLLSRLSGKDRKTFDRQIAARETNAPSPELVTRWKRFTCLLTTLAPSPAKFSGADTIQFFIPDGKYRKQVFAINARNDGSLAIYLEDILDDALTAGLLAPGNAGDAPNMFRAPPNGDLLVVEALDGRTANPQAYFKDMTGWNRKALCVVLPTEAGEVHIRAVEKLCTLASRRWPASASAPPAKPSAQ